MPCLHSQLIVADVYSSLLHTITSAMASAPEGGLCNGNSKTCIQVPSLILNSEIITVETAQSLMIGVKENFY